MKKPKIYTKTGDFGETSLIGGKRVPKNHPRIEAYGTIDELNSFVGLIRDLTESSDIKAVLLTVQNQLFVAESMLASENIDKSTIPVLTEDDTLFLETHIDSFSNELEPLNSFILPGGHTLVSYCHVARCVCRRAERLTIAVVNESLKNQICAIYLNRLSDFLFILSRYYAKILGVSEIYWQPKKSDV